MRAFSVLFAALFAATAWAATVDSPSQETSWNAGQKSQSVTWTAVSTDPSNFTISLVNMQKTPNVNIMLKENVLTSSGSTTVDGPATGWPTGNGFQINLVQKNPTGNAILAQSEQFNITGTTVPFSSSISSSSTPTGTTPSPSSETGSSSGGDNGAMGLTIQTGFIAGLVIVGGLLA